MMRQFRDERIDGRDKLGRYDLLYTAPLHPVLIYIDTLR